MNKYFFVAISLIMMLTACGLKNSVPEATPLPPMATATPTPVSLPTETLPPGRVVLVSQPGYDPGLFQASVAKLVEGTGLSLTTVSSLLPAEITADVKIVILQTLVQNLPELLVSSPQVEFVVVSPVDLSPADNLSVIRLQTEKQNFVAGYLSTLIAYDYRSAGLLPVEEPLGAIADDAFRSGASYYCGICTSVGAPVLRFPLTARVSANSDLATWQPLVESLRVNQVYVMYVSPESANLEMLNTLAAQGYILTGGQAPPKEVLPRWGATVGQDFTSLLVDLWPGLIAGEGGKILSPNITLADINPAILSQGRQRLVEDVIEKLKSDAVYPLSVPWQ